MKLLEAADVDGLRSAALITLLALNGLRIDEALSRDVEHLTHDFGHRVLELTRKGGKRSTEALAPATARALEAYIGERTTGPIFLNRNGRRMTEPSAWRLVRRLARRAGLPAADRLSPHSLRHSAITAGVPFRGRAGFRRPCRPTHHQALRPLPQQPRPPRHLCAGQPIGTRTRQVTRAARASARGWPRSSGRQAEG